MKSSIFLLLCLGFKFIFSFSYAQEIGGYIKSSDIFTKRNVSVVEGDKNIQALRGDGGERYALVIGNASYTSIKVLTNPVNDSRAMCDVLRKLAFKVDCYENIKSKKDFRDAVDKFSIKIKEGDTALFYYAGHGMEFGGENYLLPTEASLIKKSHVEDEAVRLSFVLSEIESSKSYLSIVILDACRDNPFRKDSRSKEGGGLVAPKNAPAGSIIIYPAALGKVASDGIGKNGLFTNHLLKYIKAPKINIFEMFQLVSRDVQEETAKLVEQERLEELQVPWMNFSFAGDFCFAGCGKRVHEDEYDRIIKEKKEFEERLMQLEGDIKEMQQRTIIFQQTSDENQKSQKLSQSEVEALKKQRDDLLIKAKELENQKGEELSILQKEINVLRKQQEEYKKREQEIVQSRNRIIELEQIIARSNTSSSSGINDIKIEVLRRERDTLIGNNEILKAKQREAEVKQREFTDLQHQRLRDFERQRKELDDYKLQLEKMEKTQAGILVELKEERAYRKKVENKLHQKNEDFLKESAPFVPPAF